MKNSPLITVIVPLYNNEKFISDCLDSIFHQTYSNLEVIVINDGSTDNSGVIAENYAKKEKRLKVIHQENMGVSAARNKGIRNANGEYISFIDSDDTINLQGYTNFMIIANKTNADFVLSDIFYCYEDGKKSQIGHRGNLFENMQVIDGRCCFSRMMQNQCYISMVCNNIYKSDFLLKNKLFFPPFLHEDEFFTPMALFFAKKVAESNIDFYYYRQTANSIMRSDNEVRRSQAKISVCKSLIEFLELGLYKEDRVFSDWLSIRLMQLLHIVYFQAHKLKDVGLIRNLITPPFFPNLLNTEMLKEKTLQSFFFKKELYGITTQLRKIHLFLQNDMSMK